MNLENIKRYCREPFNGISHATGAVLSLAGLILLLSEAFQSGSVNHILAFSMFGLSMIMLYTASFLYHSLPVKKQTLKLLRKIDHSMIYVLIAGTYTPICLIVLEGNWKWGVFTTVWILAVVGIFKKFFWWNTPGWISTSFYLAMGWVGVLLLPFILDKLPLAFIIWIAAGGLAYTVGAVIYGIKKPNPIPGWFGSHEIWHLFVLFGTFSHFWAIYRYLSAYSI